MKRRYQLVINGEQLQLEVEETPPDEVLVALDGETLTARIIHVDKRGRFRIAVGDQEYTIRLQEKDKDYTVQVEGVEYTASLNQLTPASPATVVQSSSLQQEVQPAPAGTEQQPPSAPAARPSHPGALEAPLPGVIVEVRVKEGDKVKAGDVVLVLEAMKMANEIRAPNGGVIRGVHVKKGQSVEKGQPLITIS